MTNQIVDTKDFPSRKSESLTHLKAFILPLVDIGPFELDEPSKSA